MPDNCHVAEQRLSSLQRKLCRNASFHEEYTRFLSDVIDKGYAEEVPQGQLKQKEGKVWYLIMGSTTPRKENSECFLTVEHHSKAHS